MSGVVVAGHASHGLRITRRSKLTQDSNRDLAVAPGKRPPYVWRARFDQVAQRFRGESQATRGQVFLDGDRTHNGCPNGGVAVEHHPAPGRVGQCLPEGSGIRCYRGTHLRLVIGGQHLEARTVLGLAGAPYIPVAVDLRVGVCGRRGGQSHLGLGIPREAQEGVRRCGPVCRHRTSNSNVRIALQLI